MKNKKLRGLRQAFAKWCNETKNDHVQGVEEQIQKTDAIIQDLDYQLNGLDQKSKDLYDENEELRQATLDGIEIAKVSLCTSLIGCTRIDKGKRTIECRFARQSHYN